MDSRHIIEIVDRNLGARMDMSRDYSDKELKELIDSCLDSLEKRIPSIEIDREHIRKTVYNSRRRFGIIQPFLDDPEIDEIMINGTDGIFVEKHGIIEKCAERYNDRDKLFDIIQTMISWINRSVNESDPIVDARLMSGARVNVVLPPVALNGPIVTIRKFADKPFTMERLIELGSVTKEQAEFLISAVRNRKNILVSGGTSTGKTTFLNVLSSYIPKDQRIITIEDSAELRLTHENLVRLETRNANSEGKGELRMRALIKASLRMRPDRLIIGEVRDESALEMLSALCTGHEGCMSTSHANNTEDFLVRLETMALWEGHVSAHAIRQMIASGVHIIVQLSRNGPKRYVSEISRVTGIRDSKVTFEKAV